MRDPIPNGAVGRTQCWIMRGIRKFDSRFFLTQETLNVDAFAVHRTFGIPLLQTLCDNPVS